MKLISYFFVPWLFVCSTLISAQENKHQPFVERFDEFRILRYQIPVWDTIPLEEKKLVYYLTQAAYSGRDIFISQNFHANLSIRQSLELIFNTYADSKKEANYLKFVEYLKKFWFANGIHHHYSMDKFKPKFSREFFTNNLMKQSAKALPLRNGETKEQFCHRIAEIIFNPEIARKKVVLDKNEDKVLASAANFYAGVTEKEVIDYYSMLNKKHKKLPQFGLNSFLTKDEQGKIKEIKYRIGGMYDEALRKINYWLAEAAQCSRNPDQAENIKNLMKFFSRGKERDFDHYCMDWVEEEVDLIDYILGFIETYNDPLGKKGSFEGIIQIINQVATKKFGVLAEHANWFEEHSPIATKHKREEVSGISYRIVFVAGGAGDAAPSFPIGVNLPNSNWIREDFGSKSISLGNIEDAYELAAKNSGFMEEFYLPTAERELIEKYGKITGILMTGLHEVIGHASGRLLDEVKPHTETLGSYASALEEGRADLNALYYIGDPKLVDLGISPSTDIIKVSYLRYLTNGLISQLSRIKPGKNIEESHMRNRQFISRWVLERSRESKAVELVNVETPEGIKTFVKINDYQALREYFGELLREVQRIKSEGDGQAGADLVENYGVKVDQKLHQQVLKRYAKLNIASFSGFINPVFKPVFKDGEIIDIKLEEHKSFTEQMLYYSKYYSILPATKY